MGASGDGADRMAAEACVVTAPMPVRSCGGSGTGVGAGVGAGVALGDADAAACVPAGDPLRATAIVIAASESNAAAKASAMV